MKHKPYLTIDEQIKLLSSDRGLIIDDINKAKIERILTISSTIAEFSNVGVVIATRNISKLDIGGLISMVHQIVFDLNTRIEIETDYINNEFNKLIMGDV